MLLKVKKKIFIVCHENFRVSLLSRSTIPNVENSFHCIASLCIVLSKKYLLKYSIQFLKSISNCNQILIYNNDGRSNQIQSYKCNCNGN